MTQFTTIVFRNNHNRNSNKITKLIRITRDDKKSTASFEKIKLFFVTSFTHVKHPSDSLKYRSLNNHFQKQMEIRPLGW